MSDYYARDGSPLALMEWAQAMEKDDRVTGSDKIGEAHVSTVWLGLDHAFMGGPPLIFETMVFGGLNDEYQARYSTEEQAIAGHERVLAAVRAGEHLA